MKPTLTRAALAALLLYASGSMAQDVLRRGNVSEPGSLDPHQARDVYEMNVIMDLFQGLTAWGPDGSVQGDAAESWEVSEDGQVYRFHLRSGLKWSDGAPLTAEDFQYSFRRMLDPATVSPIAYLFFIIDKAKDVFAGRLPTEELGVRALDSLTFEIRLTEPALYFPQLLAHVSAAAVPRQTIEKFGKGWTQAGRMVSSGPFMLEAWRPQDEIVLRKNPYFYAAAEVALQRVIYYPVADEETALKKFRAGELDVNWGFSTTKVEWLREHLPRETRTYPQLSLFYIVVNLRKPHLRDTRVRNALSMAIDRQLLIDKMVRTGNPPAYSLVLPGTANYPEVAEASFSALPMNERIALARSLLADAGYGEDNPLEVTIEYTTARGQKNLPIVIAAMWKEIGVVTRFSMSEFKVILDNLLIGEFELFPTSWVGDYNDPTTFTMLLLPDATANYGGFRSEEYGDLHRRAAFTQDPAARAALIRQAESIAVQSQAVIPIYFNVSRYLVSSRVEGWQDNLVNFHPSRYLRLE